MHKEKPYASLNAVIWVTFQDEVFCK